MKWYPPLNWADVSETEELYNESYGVLNQYITMFYNALLILGTNELGPVNPEEALYISAVLIMSTILNVVIFGDIASLLDSLT